MVVPFQPTGVTYFNSMFERTILNVFFSGFLTFLLLLEIENIAHLFMYRTHNINKRSIDHYILFSRVFSMRGMLQTLSGLEYSAKEISTKPPDHRRQWMARQLGDAGRHDATIASTLVHTDRSLSPANLEEERLPSAAPEKLRHIGVPVRDGVPHPRVRFCRIIPPLIIRFALLTLELVIIYFSSNVSEEVTAGRSFNLRLVADNAAFNTSQSDNSPCQEFMNVPRGVEQNGSVVLCIGSESTLEFPTAEATYLHFSFNMSQNQMRYVSRDREGYEVSVYVRAFINLIGDDEVELGLLRPDLPVDGNHSKKVIQRVMNRAINRFGFDMSIEQIEEIGDDQNVIQYKYTRNFGNTSVFAIEEALLSELSQLNLDLNFTQEGEENALYVFKRDRGYFRHDNAVIAIVGKNRLAQGWLLIAWVSVLIARLIAQQFLMSFDELAYLALKKVHGADMSVGPLANVEKKDRLRIGKFSDGRVGHIGYCAASARQDLAENFYGCEAVWGSGK